MRAKAQIGFTLVEMSIVLVIIGLIVGGVLVGRDLIDAATIRAQIAQIEKFQAAVNTFRSKYGYLPGDIPDPKATQYGFVVRGAAEGQGDGSGIIEGSAFWSGGTNPCSYCPFTIGAGEAALFWSDLATANLVNGGFSGAGAVSLSSDISGLTIRQYAPEAKMGRGNYIYVWSGGWGANNSMPDGKNYFGLSRIDQINSGDGMANTSQGLTVAEAYNIDTKLDDGMPQFGRIMAIYPNDYLGGAVWAAQCDWESSQQCDGDNDNSSNGGPVTDIGNSGNGFGITNPCYDNSSGVPERYAINHNKGADISCALSFQFQ